jgi:hypothetical protein
VPFALLRASSDTVNSYDFNIAVISLFLAAMKSASSEEIEVSGIDFHSDM